MKIFQWKKVKKKCDFLSEKQTYLFEIVFKKCHDI